MFESIIKDGLTVSGAAICTGVSITLGAPIAFVYALSSGFSKNFFDNFYPSARVYSGCFLFEYGICLWI